MRSFLRMAAVAGALAIAGPASAQYTFLSPDVKPPPLRLDGWSNVVRVNVGAGFYNSGWYNCYYGFYANSCSTGSYTSFIPFLVGPQIDINLGGVSNVSVGLTIGIGTVKSNYFDGTQQVNKSSSVTMWEPTLDYVAKPGSRSDGEVARFRIGGGLVIGPDSKIGGVGRLGAGVSFFNASRLGIGLDLILEGGTMNGYWIGGLQLLASPEFHF
jgi:hypothetical protein